MTDASPRSSSPPRNNLTPPPSAGDMTTFNPVTGQLFRRAGRSHALEYLLERYSFDASDAFNNAQRSRHLPAVMLVEITQAYLRQGEIVDAVGRQIVEQTMTDMRTTVGLHDPTTEVDLFWCERLPHMVGYLRALQDQVHTLAELYDAR